jgi:hypothetical protein
LFVDSSSGHDIFPVAKKCCELLHRFAFAHKNNLPSAVSWNKQTHYNKEKEIEESLFNTGLFYRKMLILEVFDLNK